MSEGEAGYGRSTGGIERPSVTRVDPVVLNTVDHVVNADQASLGTFAAQNCVQGMKAAGASGRNVIALTGSDYTATSNDNIKADSMYCTATQAPDTSGKAVVDWTLKFLRGETITAENRTNGVVVQNPCAVDGVPFDLAPREVHALLGSFGAVAASKHRIRSVKSSAPANERRFSVTANPWARATWLTHSVVASWGGHVLNREYLRC